MYPEAWPSSPARSREAISVTDFWPRPGHMATEEELREAVLWTGGIDCINSQAFCWAIIVSLPFDSYCKKDLDWMTSLTSCSFWWPVSAMLQGTWARTGSETGKRHECRFFGVLSTNGLSRVVATSRGNKFFPGSLSHFVHVLWHPSNGTARSLRLHCKRLPNMAGSLLFQIRFYEAWLASLI